MYEIYVCMSLPLCLSVSLRHQNKVHACIKHVSPSLSLSLSLSAINMETKDKENECNKISVCMSLPLCLSGCLSLYGIKIKYMHV